MSKNSNHQQRMMKKLKKAFDYTQYMVEAVDKINGYRRHNLKTFNPLFSGFGTVGVSNKELYDLHQQENAPFEDYWEMVTEHWTNKEWAEFAKFHSSWKGGQNV